MSDKFFGDAKTDKTDVSLCVLLTKTTDGTEQTGVAYSGVTASYWRQGGSRVAITTAALSAIDSAHSDGGWKEGDSTNQPGLYRLDVPDAAFAAGADWVIVSVKVAGCFVYHERFNLGSISSNEVYGRIGSPAGASIAADIAAIPQPDLSNMAQQTTLQAVQAELESHANPAGQGARTVTVTVTDADAAPIEGARVRLKKGIETYATTTNASGVAQLFVDDGTWAYVVTCTGYSSDSGSVVVNGDEAVAAQLTAYVIPPASNPAKVNVLVRLDDFDLPNVKGTEVILMLDDDNEYPITTTAIVSDKAVKGKANANGEKTLAVYPTSRWLSEGLSSGTYTLKINGDVIKAGITVPDTSSNIATLIRGL